MSKFRPMDRDCLKCNGLKTVQAGCWVKGQYTEIDGKRKLLYKGYWKIRCIKCGVGYCG